MEYEWVEIDKNQQLFDGQRVRLYFDIIGPTYILAAQVAAIESKLAKETRFKVISHSLPTSGGWFNSMYWECQVTTPGVTGTWLAVTGTITGAVIASAIAAAFIATSVFVWLTFRKVELKQFVEEVTETIKETGWTALKIAAAAILGVVAIKWWGK